MELFSNNAITELTANINSEETVFEVSDGSQFATPTGDDFQRLTLYHNSYPVVISEIVYLIARDGNMLTVIRAREDSEARNWIAGDLIANQQTAGTMQDIYDALHETQQLIANLEGAIQDIQNGGGGTGSGSSNSVYGEFSLEEILPAIVNDGSNCWLEYQWDVLNTPELRIQIPQSEWTALENHAFDFGYSVDGLHIAMSGLHDDNDPSKYQRLSCVILQNAYNSIRFVDGANQELQSVSDNFIRGEFFRRFSNDIYAYELSYKNLLM